MCGRMTLTATEPLLLQEIFGLVEMPEAPQPRFNIAPTQVVQVVTGETPRLLSTAKWGLIPSWAKDEKIASSLINARAETVATKPAFRAAFKRRRCLIAVDGWYEWQATEDGKLPWRFHRPDGRPFAIAGLWEERTDPTGAKQRTCTVVTTSANPYTAAYHDRMPVLLPKDAFEPWLAPAELTMTDAAHLLRPCPEEWVVADRVSKLVNSPRNDRPEVLLP